MEAIQENPQSDTTGELVALQGCDNLAAQVDNAQPAAINSIDLTYTLNKHKAIKKKLDACDRPEIVYKVHTQGMLFELNTVTYMR